MKTHRYDGSRLKRVLASMVTDQTVCSRIAAQWKGDGLFDSAYANLVGRWCVEHLQRFGTPPNGQLVSQLERWVSKVKPDDKVQQLVERLVREVQNEVKKGEQANTEYMIDLADKYLNEVRVRKAVEDAQGELDVGQAEKAYERLTSINRIELGQGSLVKPAEEFDVWRQAFDKTRQPQLFGYPGDLDGFLGRHMTRNHLISFMAPEKTGKTTWLRDASYRALRAKRRVAYFEVGDSDQDEVLLWFGIRAARVPEEAGVIRVPERVNKDGRVKRKQVEHESGISPGAAFKAFKRVCKSSDSFRLSCHPNSSMDVMGIRSMLLDWGREGWVADVVVIDYADILAPPSGIKDLLQQIEVTWKQLRRISQEFHSLVLTATQASAAAYSDKVKTLSKRHFSGRKTKLAEVNGMVGINVSNEDKRRGVTRINWIARRKGYYSETRYCTVAGCMDICNPAIRSIL